MALFENENILGERQGTFRRDRHIDMHISRFVDRQNNTPLPIAI
jgi:hypothetical protein